LVLARDACRDGDCALNRRADGETWSTVAIAAHPGTASWSAAVPHADADDRGNVRLGEALVAGDRTLRAAVGEARVDLELDHTMPWPRRAFGGIGPAQVIPGLSQYWHPWLLHATVRGRAHLGGRVIDLDGATAYAEKNWSPAGGFPEAWWWGQAHGFDRDDLCVAFAGGHAGLGRVRGTATSVVVATERGLVRLVRPVQPLHVAVGERGWLLRGRSLRGTEVEVEGHANGTRAHLLPVPLPEAGRNHPDAASQHLAGEMRVRLARRGRTVYEGVSQLAGLEQGSGRPG
jgi:tocopherol cyclase